VRRAVGTEGCDDGVVVVEEERGLVVGEACHLELTVPAAVGFESWV
jgi:hypothetical protein